MKEQENYIAWYRLRGMGLVSLCSLVFFFGAYLANQRSVAVNGAAGARMAPVECVQTEEKKAALSFDVVSGENIREILNILEKSGVKATFFVTGSWAEAHPQETKDIAAGGHDLGNAGESRRSMTELTGQEVQRELQEAHETVQELTGADMKLFRAPYGDYDDALVKAAKAAGYLPVRWSVDSEDWKDYGVESVIRKVTENKRLGPGAIIRMHGGAEYTPHALETVIGALRRQGYALVPVSQLVLSGAYRVDENGRQIPE